MKIIIYVIISISIIILLSFIIWFLFKKSRTVCLKENFMEYNTIIQNIDSIHKLSLPYILKGEVNQNKLFKKGYMNHTVQKENLKLLKHFMESHNIEYYIDCGTLLGAIRENKIIEGDQDADLQLSKIGIKQLRSHLAELEKLGFISFRNSDTWLPLSLLRKGEYIDLYSLWTSIPFDLIMYPFLGTTFPIPKYYDEYLTELYGNWRIPDKNGKGLGNWEKGMVEYLKKYKL